MHNGWAKLESSNHRSYSFQHIKSRSSFPDESIKNSLNKKSDFPSKSLKRSHQYQISCRRKLQWNFSIIWIFIASVVLYYMFVIRSLKITRWIESNCRVPVQCNCASQKLVGFNFLRFKRKITITNLRNGILNTFELRNFNRKA